MYEPRRGFERVPGRRQRPVARGLIAMIAAVLILSCGLLVGRMLLDNQPEPARPTAPTPIASRSTA